MHKFFNMKIKISFANVNDYNQVVVNITCSFFCHAYIDDHNLKTTIDQTIRVRVTFAKFHTFIDIQSKKIDANRKIYRFLRQNLRQNLQHKRWNRFNVNIDNIFFHCVEICFDRHLILFLNRSFFFIIFRVVFACFLSHFRRRKISNQQAIYINNAFQIIEYLFLIIFTKLRVLNL